MIKDITGIIAWLRGWFDDIYSDINHNHRVTRFSTVTYSSTYVSGSKHCHFTAIDNLAVLDYYLTLQNIPTSNTIIISNVPTQYQTLSGYEVEEIISDTSGHRFLLRIDSDGSIKAKAYSSTNNGGTVTGQIAYRCKGVTA